MFGSCGGCVTRSRLVVGKRLVRTLHREIPLMLFIRCYMCYCFILGVIRVLSDLSLIPHLGVFLSGPLNPHIALDPKTRGLFWHKSAILDPRWTRTRWPCLQPGLPSRMSARWYGRKNLLWNWPHITVFGTKHFSSFQQQIVNPSLWSMKLCCRTNDAFPPAWWSYFVQNLNGPQRPT